uniref:Uncharacterized protein n=1 Tax=Oryza brachyantha TaxID=4533 RepID=J3MYX2_ORYBR
TSSGMCHSGDFYYSLADTNCDPHLANISIPANGNTMTSIRLTLNKLVSHI